MALETGSYISDLNSSNPQSSDSVSQADDHIRLIKATVKATFPNVTGAVTKTHSQINDLLEKAGGTMTGALTLSGAPSSNLHAATKLYVDTADATKAATSTTITAGTGLSGGGDLSANRTISVASGGITATQLASDAVTTAKILDANVTPAKLSQPLTQGTAVATTSGTEKDFTGIPSWAKRITLVLNAVSLSGSALIRFRLGDSGGFATSGYAGAGSVISAGAATANQTAGFDIYTNVANASYAYSGVITFTNVSGNIWVASGVFGTGSVAWTHTVGGVVTLSGTLTQVRLTTSNGTDTLDAGSANILYE